MAKYTEKLTDKIVSLIEEDTYTVAEICNHLKITRKSFYEWKEKKPEFREAVNKAIERRNETLGIIARNSLKRKLEGYTLTEVRTTYIPDKDNPDKLILKSRIVKEKEYAPDTHAIRLTLLPNDTKPMGVKEEPAALTIIVRDTKTAEQLNLLQNNLMHPKQKGEPYHPAPGTESAEKTSNSCEEVAGQACTGNNTADIKDEKRAEPEVKAESPDDLVCVDRNDVPPGYLFRVIKRSELRPGEAYKNYAPFSGVSLPQPKRKPKSPDDLVRVRRDSSGYTCIIKRSELMPGEAFKDYVQDKK
ncbi:phBC6A51 family helix-turn-helix protein [Dysgonomonas sp. 521]|uniref:phBC6A51 family helix-turn-helix protein n=1 Tax=Dysgonomonas sp. 521 TaxID=2302932 RepID=UPI001627C2E2|nr:phBC6A51 family helix-turn-helix protein [Dysgonomonas sp. 521]